MVAVSNNPVDWLSYIYNRKAASEEERQCADRFIDQFN
jgi:hypothetical protein